MPPDEQRDRFDKEFLPEEEAEDKPEFLDTKLGDATFHGVNFVARVANILHGRRRPWRRHVPVPQDEGEADGEPPALGTAATVLIWVAGIVVGALVIVGLFV